jgi:hypothetical protein
MTIHRLLKLRWREEVWDASAAAWSMCFFLSSSSLRPLSGDDEAKRFVVVEVVATFVVVDGVIESVMNNSDDAVLWRVSWSLLSLLLLGPSSRLPKKLGRRAADGGPHEFGRDFDGTFCNERSADDDPQQPQPTMTITMVMLIWLVRQEWW